MADKRITQLTASSGLVATDILPVVDDPGGTPETQKATVQQVADALETIYVADGSFAVPGSIALGTDTTGNYVADVSGGTGVTVTHTPGEGSTPSVAIGQDVAASASPTFAGLTINGASIILEGTTADEYETTISVTDPTADRTITIPDATGTVALNGTIALGTDTTGNYVSDVAGGTGISVSHTPGEGSTATVSPNVGGLSASSGLTSTDEVMVLDDPGGTPTHEKATIAQIADAVETIYSTDTFVLVGEYTAKGDLAVGASASAGDITTLAVGANGTVLVADSGETSGLKYADKELITVPSAQTGATYTLALTDKSSVVRMNRATAQTLTVPPNSSVAFPIGSQVIIVAMGAGAVTIAAGSGVTLRSKDSDLKIDGQYAMAACVKIDTNEWIVTGQLTS